MTETPDSGETFLSPPAQPHSQPPLPPHSEPPSRRGRPAAFFDLDKTVVAKSTTLVFSRPFFDGGLINRRSVLKSSVAQFLFLFSDADHDQVENLRRHVTEMCTGWDVEQVGTIVTETLEDIVAPLVFAEAAELIDRHHADGLDVILVSASGREIVEPIGAMLGVDHVRASRMTVVDGRYSGDLEFYCYGENKVAAMEELAQRHGYDLTTSYAYSDSITDVPMLSAVGHPVTVNPDRGLRRHAVENGWPVLTFEHPVDLRTRIRPVATRTATAVGIGVAAAGACAVGFRAVRGHKRR